MRPTRAQCLATVRRCVAVAAGGAVLAWGGAGCASPRTEAAAKPDATAGILVTNRSPYAWRVAFRTTDGIEVRVVEVKPDAASEVRVAGGADYLIEQTVVTSGATMTGARTVAVRFEPGERYAWNLATLLTSGDGAAGAGETRAP